jgi:3-hydroxyisobutyrate dehydrogenase-like beta-hydroxyacid dehydrogenase
MARKLIEAGFETKLYARRAATLEPFGDSSARVAASLVELGRESDVVGVCVIDDTDVEEVVVPPHGILSEMAPGAIVLVHSTVHPETCVRLAQVASDHGVILLDAPVTGGGESAERRELVVMVGGDRAAFDRCQGIFGAYARLSVHIGGVGAAQSAKLVNNLIVYSQIALVHDGFTLAEALGVDREALAAVLSQGAGRSFSLDFYLSYGPPGTTECLDGLRKRMGDLVKKDVSLARQLAAAHGAALAGLDDSGARAVALMGPAPVAG